ncbi:MAG: hypothetical protein QXU18_02345 [Thermoplasmatales archaeon]
MLRSILGPSARSFSIGHLLTAERFQRTSPDGANVLIDPEMANKFRKGSTLMFSIFNFLFGGDLAFDERKGRGETESISRAKGIGAGNLPLFLTDYTPFLTR